jgi:hypothetical protein
MACSTSRQWHSMQWAILFLLLACPVSLSVSAQLPPVRRDKLAVVLYNFEGNTTTAKDGTQVPLTYLGDPVAASREYFARVKRHWEEDSNGAWLMEVAGVYGPYLLPRPAGSPNACLWDPRVPAIGAAVSAVIAANVPADATILWLFPPCGGDQLIRWGTKAYVQNQGGKLSTVYGLWHLELSNGWPWYGVLHCVDAAGMPVPVSQTCTSPRPVGVGGDPVPTGLFFHTPANIKRRLGFLTDANRLLLAESGTYTFTLPPMERLVAGPMYAEIKVPTGDGQPSTRTFFAEWRQKIGLDAGLPNGLDQGLMIRLGNNSIDLTPATQKDNPTLTVGQTLRLAPSAATITLLAIEPGVQATVRVVIP